MKHGILGQQDVRHLIESYRMLGDLVSLDDGGVAQGPSTTG